MPRGLAKATNYYNLLEAIYDWNDSAAEITAAGYGDLVAKHNPPEGAGWRTIDKARAALLKEYEAMKGDEG